MEWNKFTESNREYPEEIVSRTINGFSKATSNLLDIQITPVTEYVGELYVDFEFRVFLVSNYIKTYQFEIFKFGYNVDIFPVQSILDESIFQELTGKKMKYKEKSKFKDEIEFISYLNAVFNSERFAEVVSGLMKITRKYANK